MIFTDNKEPDIFVVEENFSNYYIMYGGFRHGMSWIGSTEQEYLRIRETVRDSLWNGMGNYDFYGK